ncbi:MAG: 2-C-methyl-D-erythritol 4-phosphate cytidylyltransferase [Flavobacteriales bacterium]|nr:2-C-methyl-D-erythritol 4-phosphate cytidylyltransferase [Flavobacteriales bacterium]
MQRSTIIVAGGSGKRMGAAVPKQFLLLKGRPLLMWTIESFQRFDPNMQLVVVLPKDHHATWQGLCAEHGFTVPHTLVSGGAERFHSTLEGLKAVEHDGLVAVHDGVRPLVSAALIARCFAASEEHGAAIPVVAISSSVRELTAEGKSTALLSPSTPLRESRAVDRSRLRAVQTPQCFRLPLLRRAFELPYDPAFTDEATLVERLGVDVHLVEGEEHNIKVTTPFDLKVAEVVMGAQG